MTPGEIRQRVLALRTDRKPVPLEFDGWGDGLFVRVLSANDQQQLATEDNETKLPVRILLACLVDSSGERIFTDEDQAALGDLPFPEVMQAFGEVAKLNGLSNKELEEAVANFVKAPDEQRSIG